MQILNYDRKCILLLCSLWMMIRLDSATIPINVAVLPNDWMSLDIQEISTHPFTLQNLTVNNPRSKYDYMVKVKRYLQTNNVHMIFGTCNNQIITVSEKLNIPYICTTWTRKENLTTVFQLMPPLRDFSHAIFDLVERFQWKEVTLFYDDDRGLQILEDLLTNHNLKIKSWKLHDRGSDSELEADVRHFLVSMRRSFIMKLIVICNKRITRVIFQQAWALAMMSSPYEWILYDPGIALEDTYINHNDLVVNITSLTLIDQLFIRKSSSVSLLHASLAKDAMTLILSSVLQSQYSGYDSKDAIMRNLRHTRIKGVTGDIQFNEKGQRTNYDIKLNNFCGHKIQHMGLWRSKKNKIGELVLEPTPVITDFPFPLKNRTVKVVMIEESPFTMLKAGYENKTGNDRYEGYCVDLLSEVAKELNFHFEIYIVHDKKFGSKNSKGEWNGIIGELLIGNATMSVAPLSINAEREGAVDFTKPFMTRYINVLMKLPPSDRSSFEFLYPLNVNVYIYTVVAFVVVGIILFLLEKYGINHGAIQTIITFQESLWFVCGSLLQGSTDATPTTTPGRILTSAWWFFVLILVSSYTANLAAFLTVKKINTPIKSVMDLSAQSRVSFGTVKSSAVTLFFTKTEIESFRLMGEQMLEVDKSAMVDTSEEGFKKVNEGNYAFFWDSTVNRYRANRNCNLVEIGPPFGPRGFGIGTPPGATYLANLSMTILRLSDTGVLNLLEEKWWKRRNCPSQIDPAADDANELQLDNLAGVFYILSGGIIFAIILCIFEFVFKMNKKKDNSSEFYRVPVREEDIRRQCDIEYETSRKFCLDNGIDA